MSIFLPAKIRSQISLTAPAPPGFVVRWKAIVLTVLTWGWASATQQPIPTSLITAISLTSSPI